MISICVCFYPWYREHERTQEIFDVLISSINKIDRIEEVELSLVCVGDEDVWMNRRHPETARTFDWHKFYNDVKQSCQCKLSYTFTTSCINETSYRRVWITKALELSVLQSTHENIFINGMDITLPKEFVRLYENVVEKRRAWVVHPYAIPGGAELKILKQSKSGYGWQGARGVVGILKSDFKYIGGFEPENYIKDRGDSNFYNKLLKHEFEIVEEKIDGFFHVGHPGSNFARGRFWHVDLLKGED